MRQLLKLAFYWFSISRQSGCIKTNHSGHPGMDSRKTLLNHRDYFPVSLHSRNCRHLPAVRAVQGDWLSFSGLKKMEKIPRMHCSLPTIWSRRAAPNLYLDHQQATPANWRPCLIPHWQFYNHQARTVKQSIKSLQNGWLCIIKW